MKLYDSNGIPLLAPSAVWMLNDSETAQLFNTFGATMYEAHLRFEWDSDNQKIIEIVDGVTYINELGETHRIDIPVPDSWDSGQFIDLRQLKADTLLKWAKAQENKNLK